ncbi:unnamed protein product [Didymodactylos carnosus]|uniref:Uncharacterized protein n=1 Tax=Didymodactylos carnosus TaxID=1234261 RepID=A0A8S2G3Y1_9BILA|nr:unnamed protein product [Didymodactylos carnosus]CAF4439618.1 unnamed protein product [Didymodactylos carnosus]
MLPDIFLFLILISRILTINITYDELDVEDNQYLDVNGEIILINNEELYQSADHDVKQLLYRNDQINLACTCTQRHSDEYFNYYFYWTINNILVKNDSTRIHLTINSSDKLITEPITTVYCHCQYKNYTQVWFYTLHIGR